MRLLVTGAAGLVGSRVSLAAAQRGHEVHAAIHAQPFAAAPGPVHAMDRGDPARVRRVLEEAAPEVVVDCASWTDVDGCEGDPARAERDNAQGARHVAEAAAAQGARVVHVGTDFVFDGAKRRPYREDDPPAPQSVYARTKRAAEEAVLQGAGNAVVRSSVLYGAHPTKPGFAGWLVRQLRAGREVRVSHDMWCTPTLADSLAGALVTAAERPVSGVYHAAGADCVSREAFAREVARTFGLDEALILPVPTASLGLKAARPAYGCLSSQRATRDLAYAPLPLPVALARYRESEGGTPQASSR